MGFIDGFDATNGYGTDFDAARVAGGADGTVTKTGTTTVALAARDGVVLAADMRASLGGRFVSNKDMRKVEAVHPTAALTISGTVGGAQAFVRSLRAEVELYRTRRGEEMSVNALATVAGNFLRGGQFMFQPILGGVDERGSHVYTLDGAGGVMCDDYAASGSGMQLAYGVLEGRYDGEMDVADARRLAVDAIGSAVERDTASGDGVTVAEITGDVRESDDSRANQNSLSPGDGVEIEGFAGFEGVR